MSAKTTVTATASGYPPLRRPLASHPRLINSPNMPRAVSYPNSNKRPRSPDPSLPTAPVVAHPALKRLKKEHITATIGKDIISRASTTSKPSLSPASKPAKRSKADKVAAEEEFRVKYGRAFPLWKFYFEAVPQAAVASTTRKILELNGTVEEFLSNNCTHFITASRINNENKAQTSRILEIPKQGGTLRSPIDLQKKYDPLARAKEWGIKIWDINKLESVLDRVLARPATQAPRRTPNLTLTHLLATEKAAGATLERDPRERRHDYTYFKKGSYFVLIEDITGEHQPIGRMEFKPPRPGVAVEWPVLHLDPRMRNPFQAYSPKTAGKERTFAEREDNNKSQRVASIRELRALKRRDELRRTASLNNLRTAAELEGLNANTTTATANAQARSFIFRQETDTIGERMASGYLVSGNSTALPTTETSLLSTSVSLSRLTGSGTVLPGGMRHARPQVTMNRRVGDLRRVKSAMNLRGEVKKVEKEKKTGYCECCRITFEDYDEHIIQKKHRRFATDHRHWGELDAVLARLSRPLKPGYASWAVGSSVADPETQETQPHVDVRSMSRATSHTTTSTAATNESGSSKGHCIILSSDSPAPQTRSPLHNNRIYPQPQQPGGLALELEMAHSTSEGIPLARLLADRERAVKKASMIGGAVGGLASGGLVGMGLISAGEGMRGAVGPVPQWDSELEVGDGPEPMFI